MEPYEQGALDGLCGIYSIINATRKVVKINSAQSQELFNNIMEFLDEKWGLKRVMIDGISLHDISQVLNTIIKPQYPIESYAPFWHFTDTSLDVFWNEMMIFTKANNAILIGIGGMVYDHWTVVESISNDQIKLFDSYKLKRFDRRRCTTQEATSKRKHQLYPTKTYFLRSASQ
jgi:hypothetical protein